MDEARSELIDEALAVLNRALELDQIAVSALMARRVACAEGFAADPTIQVGRFNDDPEEGLELGPLGLINGLFGARPDGWGYVTAHANEDTGMIERFALTHREGDD